MQPRRRELRAKLSKAMVVPAATKISRGLPVQSEGPTRHHRAVSKSSLPSKRPKTIEKRYKSTKSRPRHRQQRRPERQNWLILLPLAAPKKPKNNLFLPLKRSSRPPRRRKRSPCRKMLSSLPAKAKSKCQTMIQVV